MQWLNTACLAVFGSVAAIIQLLTCTTHWGKYPYNHKGGGLIVLIRQLQAVLIRQLQAITLYLCSFQMIFSHSPYMVKVVGMLVFNHWLWVIYWRASQCTSPLPCQWTCVYTFSQSLQPAPVHCICIGLSLLCKCLLTCSKDSSRLPSCTVWPGILLHKISCQHLGLLSVGNWKKRECTLLILSWRTVKLLNCSRKT